MGGLGQAGCHEGGHGPQDHGFVAGREAFVVADARVPRNSRVLEVPGWQVRRSESGGLVARPEIHRDTVTC